jgi:hypothetical protein
LFDGEEGRSVRVAGYKIVRGRRRKKCPEKQKAGEYREQEERVYIAGD